MNTPSASGLDGGVRRMNVMISLKRHMWSTLAVFVFLAPSSAPAQPVANSFEELRQVLKKSQTVVVTDASGRQTKGKVADVSASSLVVSIPETRAFAEGTVREIRRTDTSRNGALIGLVVGVGAGIAAIKAMCYDGPDCGPWLMVGAETAGIGAAIGAGIDALVNKGGKVIYRSPQQTPELTISPLLGKDRQGVLVSVHF